MNEGIQKIGNNAFRGCSSLESISLPSSLVEIGKEVFDNCIHLSELACSGALPSVEWNTFSGCSALERITFPSLSTRLDNIIQSGHVDIQNKIQQYFNRGDIEWNRGGGTLYISVNETRRRDRWASVQQHFSQIIKWIKYYEMKEATTLFELALWKAKIDQVEDDVYERERDACRGIRDECRIEVPGPVKDAIIQYIDL